MSRGDLSMGGGMSDDMNAMAGSGNFNAGRNDVHDLPNARSKAGADSDEPCRQLNSFLRGEISAAETYRMAIEKVSSTNDVSGAANVSLLREIQEEHGRAAQALRDRIRELGGDPADSSGPWGAWAKTIQGTMNLFGDASALKSLKEGEEHGLKDYQEGIDDIDMTSADLISNQLIPAQQRHINLLDQLISATGRA